MFGGVSINSNYMIIFIAGLIISWRRGFPVPPASASRCRLLNGGVVTFGVGADVVGRQVLHLEVL